MVHVACGYNVMVHLLYVDVVIPLAERRSSNPILCRSQWESFFSSIVPGQKYFPSEYCIWQMPSTVALMVELRIRSLCQQQRLKLQDLSIFYSHYLHRMRFFVCRRLAMYLPCALHCRALSGSARSLA